MTEEPQSNFEPQAPDTDRLIEVLEELDSHIKIQNSLRRTFIKGLIYGLGTVVGATVLVALFGGIIATTIQVFDEDANPEELLEELP